MSCDYCGYSSNMPSKSSRGRIGGDCAKSEISYDAEDGTFNLYTLDSFDLKTEIHKVDGVKYCPFCGEKLKAPSKENLETLRNWDRDWERRRKEAAKAEAKREKERREWLEREYEKNPYDPTQPRIKDKNFRNAVKYLAKYMGIKEFYWDTHFRQLSGSTGGYIKIDSYPPEVRKRWEAAGLSSIGSREEVSIGPCYETNGVMEHGKYYTVEELCGEEEE